MKLESSNRSAPVGRTFGEEATPSRGGKSRRTRRVRGSGEQGRGGRIGFCSFAAGILC